MASGPEFRMVESSKIDLLTQLLAAAISIIRDATVSLPSIETPVKSHRSSKRDRTTKTNGNGGEGHEDHENNNGNVVPIGPLIKSPVDPRKKYNLKFVAKYLHIGEQTIRNRIREGALAAERDGNGPRAMWVVTGEEIIRFSNSSTTGDPL